MTTTAADGLPPLIDYIAFAQQKELMKLVGNGKAFFLASSAFAAFLLLTHDCVKTLLTFYCSV